MDEDIVMSDLVASRLGDPLSSVPLLADDQTSESINLVKDQFQASYVAKGTKSRPILSSEWSQLKGLLRHLYIEKDQTLKAVQRYLRERHSLIVTEKQLTRKFSDWNLRKNVKKCQRKALIQEYRVTQDTQLVENDCGKITEQKLIRWEREFAGSSRPKSSMWFDESSNNLTGNKDEQVDLESIHVSERMEMLPTGTNSTLGVVSNQKEDTTILIVKLFAKFGLDAPADIESWHTKVQPTEEITTSHDDLVPVTDIHPSVLSGSNKYTMVNIRPPTPKLRLECVTNQQITPFKWDNMDVVFSTGLWVQPTPYNELYPFATDPRRVQNISAFSSVDASIRRVYGETVSSVDLNLQESLCKIEKLRPLCQASHEGLIMEIWTVIKIYSDKKDYLNSEHWCRESIKCVKSDTELVGVRICSGLMLSYNLLERGEREEAKEEHQTAHKLLSSSSITHRDIVDHSLRMGAIIASDLGDNEDIERWFKQLAQLRLMTHGPRSQNTITILLRLSEIFLTQHNYLDCEELLWILTDLLKTNMNLAHRETAEVAFLLAKSMFKQRRFKDAEVWFKNSLQIIETRCGSNDSLALEAETGLAITLKSQNRLEEGERLLRSNVEKLVRARGENSLTATLPMKHLGFLLMDENRYKDAVIWFERCFKIRLLELEPIEEITFNTFSYLIECYLHTERREDASNSIRGYIEAIKKVSEVHEYIIKLETWLGIICKDTDL